MVLNKVQEYADVLKFHCQTVDLSTNANVVSTYISETV